MTKNYLTNCQGFNKKPGKNLTFRIFFVYLYIETIITIY